MAEELIEKQELFDGMWHTFKGIKDVLRAAKIPSNRMLDYNKLQELMFDTHINKLRHSKEWLDNFIKTHIAPWRKIRAENTEQYWDNIEALGMGEDFTEVKKMEELCRYIRRDWFTTHNFLAPKKKKKEKKPDHGQE